jgi:RNA polymerase sigma-70 factor (ECF subfamily)
LDSDRNRETDGSNGDGGGISAGITGGEGAETGGGRAGNNFFLADTFSGMDRPGDDGEACFEAIFRTYHREVLAFGIRRLPSRSLAEDVAAETFAVAWRRRRLIPEDPRLWLFAIALRVIANQRRSLRRREALGQRLAGEAHVLASAGDPAEALDLRRSFGEAFRKLDEDDREILRLHAWEGLAPAEAALVLGCSPAAYRVRLHRARRRLEKQLAATGHSPDMGEITDDRQREATE